jgi:hypothetical protein
MNNFTIAIHFIGAVATLSIDAFAIDTNGIVFAAIATRTTIRNIIQRVGSTTITISWPGAIDAFVVFTDFAISTLVVAATTTIDVANLDFITTAISLPIADFAFTIDTGFAVGAAIITFATVIERTVGIHFAARTRHIADAISAGAS